MQKKPLDANPVEQLFERLLVVYGVKNPVELAAAMGENLSTVKGWKQRGSVPLEHCVKAWRDTNCSLDWLVLGLLQSQNASPDDQAVRLMEPDLAWLKGLPSDTHTGGSRPGASAALLQIRGAGAVRPVVLSIPKGEPGGHSKDYQVIPRHVRYAAAGKMVADGAEPDHVDLAGDMAFSFSWLKQNMGHSSGKLSSVQVRGDSMATTLLDGDTIIIDEGVKQVEVDGIYVFDFYGRRMVKRLQQLFDGTLLLISDNPNYQRETVPRDRARDVHVIGRMVWPRVR